MSLITKQMSYGEIVAIITRLESTIISTASPIIIGAAYEGFDAKALFEEFLAMVESLKKTQDMMVADLVMLIGMLHARGPNISKFTAENTRSKETYIKMKSILTEYKIQSKASGKPRAITLPRLSTIFASLSFQVFLGVESSLVSFSISQNELGLIGSQWLLPNYVPPLCTEADLKTSDELAIKFFVHNMYQSHLTLKTQATKVKEQASDALGESTKYSVLSLRGSLIPVNEKQAFVSKPLGFTKADFLKSLELFLTPMTRYTILFFPTKYHILTSYLIKSNKTFKDIPSADWEASYDTIKMKYSIGMVG